MNTPQTPERHRRLVRFEIAPKSLAAIVLVGFSLWLLRVLWPILLVIVFALILTGTLNPIVGWLEERRMKRGWAVTLVFGTCALLLGLLALLIFPPLMDQVTRLLGNMPAIQTKLAGLLEMHRLTVPLATTVRTFVPAKAATGNTANSAFELTLGVVEGLGYAGSSIALALYFISDFERMRGILYALTPRAYHIRLARILLNMQPIVGGYMRGQVITSLLIGVFAFALLSICRVPNAMALAAFAGITDIFPFIGGLLATLPAVLAALLSRGAVTATVVCIAMVVYQEFENRVLIPRIYGRVLRLPSAAVVIALLIGGKLGGIIGALLALPLASVTRMLIEELRLDLPGDDTDDTAVKLRDAKAEQVYATQSAGASPAEAGTVAIRIADEVLEAGGTDSILPPPNPN